MTPKTAARDTMTPVQVAEYLQINKITVYRYIRDGRLPAVRIGRALRVMRADVDRFLAAHRVVVPTARHVIPDRAAAGRLMYEQGPYTGPSHAERRPSRDDLINIHPLDWVARGLH